MPALRRAKAGQSIKEDGPVWHMSKQGTPTMGGIIFILGITVAMFTAGLGEIMNGNYTHLFILAFGMIYGAIGFLTITEAQKKAEYRPVRRTEVYTSACGGNSIYFSYAPYGALNAKPVHSVFNVEIVMNEVVYFILAAFIIVGCVNAVNITDGIDGLATGVSIPVALCYVAISFSWGYVSQGIFAAALAGGLVGFLVLISTRQRCLWGIRAPCFWGE